MPQANPQETGLAGSDVIKSVDDAVDIMSYKSLPLTSLPGRQGFDRMIDRDIGPSLGVIRHEYVNGRPVLLTFSLT